jgi:hypothetical protein
LTSGFRVEILRFLIARGLKSAAHNAD